MQNMRIAAKFLPVRAPVAVTGVPVAAKAVLWAAMGAPSAGTSAPTAAAGAPIECDRDAYTMRMLCGTYAEYAYYS